MQSTVCPAIACDRASKSNIWSRILKARQRKRSEQSRKPLTYVATASSSAVKTAIIAGAPQPVGLAFGEILIAAADLFGHLDEFNIRPGAERGIGRQHQFPETARGAGADIEQPRDLRRRQIATSSPATTSST